MQEFESNLLNNTDNSIQTTDDHINNTNTPDESTNDDYNNMIDETNVTTDSVKDNSSLQDRHLPTDEEDTSNEPPKKRYRYQKSHSPWKGNDAFKWKDNSTPWLTTT